ncbi:efflux RND transporter periplasmic adaptor subunit [Sphingomonas sp. AP4-R1]|uniref:efflux RND transporter periplasmic adaptor subunit n=1 Tax=Sphingomonas sp. AP4-R1 TaxID=2735134 RepID=UPI0014935F51|nr:efflux RND transporter periplasmic adaptor subunit [Sphingomonas sp. AP4-R1]QJU57345.1 efflux RND transporter periplasmic adaptor subunit [Sphingomonas sp. AP4-R1]
MKTQTSRMLLSALLPLALTACGKSDKKADDMAGMDMSKDGGKPADKDAVALSARQIADAGIETALPTVGGVTGAIELPGLVQGDPQGVQVVSATIGGRLVSLTRNLGQTVRQGDPLAIIESREAASLTAEVEAARARAGLAQSNLRREQRLFAERVSPEQDLIAARTAATEAGIALRLAQQQLGATGGSGGALNRISMRSPISGQVIARPAVLGQTVDANAELYRVANLKQVTVQISLPPTDAGRVRPGMRVEVSAAGRKQDGRVTFVSPVLDDNTRLVQLIATLSNADGIWRVGEPVTAAIMLPAIGDRSIAVPSTAVQSVENRTVVFVRTPTGFRAAPVATGRRNGDQVTITSGLVGTERVATTNSFTLKAELGKGGEMEM